MAQLAAFHRVDQVEGSAYPLPVTFGYQTQWRWVYRLDLPTGALLAGDILDVVAEHEFTNDTGIRIEIVTAITLTDGGAYYDEDLVGLHASPKNGLFICPPIGGDVLRADEHHRPVVRCGAVQIPTPSPYSAQATILFRARARSDAVTGSQSIAIEPTGYGPMDVKIFR
jgi:hypothetical protein